MDFKHLADPVLNGSTFQYDGHNFRWDASSKHLCYEYGGAKIEIYTGHVNEPGFFGQSYDYCGAYVDGVSMGTWKYATWQIKDQNLVEAVECGLRAWSVQAGLSQKQALAKLAAASGRPVATEFNPGPKVRWLLLTLTTLVGFVLFYVVFAFAGSEGKINLDFARNAAICLFGIFYLLGSLNLLFKGLGIIKPSED
jgi:hypothetical protein